MHSAMAAIRLHPCSTLVRPLRSAAAGGTFALRCEAPAKNEFQGTRMAATRTDCGGDNKVVDGRDVVVFHHFPLFLISPQGANP